MQLFFEEESSKKLIWTQQIVLATIVSYVEVMGQYLVDNPKILNAVKNILQNVHKNYLVFVEFINKNLTPEQRSKTHEWASSLEAILENRPSVKTYYKNTNS